MCSKLYYLADGDIYGNHYCEDDLEHLNLCSPSLSEEAKLFVHISQFLASNLLFLWQYDDWRDVQHFQTTAPTSGVQQPVLENLDFEVQSKLDGLIEKNMASLNREQDEWSEAMRKMADYSTGIVLGRADIEQKCSKVEEITRVLEEKVWQRQASSVAVTHHGGQQLDSPDCLGSGEQDQRRGENNDKSCQEKVVENIRVKEMEMENMMEALTRSKKMVSELRTCHVSCVIHQEEMELRTEVKEVEEMWKREKAELEDGLDGEIKRVALIAGELEEN